MCAKFLNHSSTISKRWRDTHLLARKVIRCVVSGITQLRSMVSTLTTAWQARCWNRTVVRFPSYEIAFIVWVLPTIDARESCLAALPRLSCHICIAHATLSSCSTRRHSRWRQANRSPSFSAFTLYECSFDVASPQSY